MNVLTKDELQIILLDMDINIHKAPPLKPSPSYLALRDKIEMMIKEVCEHKRGSRRDYDKPDNSFSCRDCGEMMNE